LVEFQGGRRVSKAHEEPHQSVFGHQQQRRQFLRFLFDGIYQRTLAAFICYRELKANPQICGSKRKRVDKLVCNGVAETGRKLMRASLFGNTRRLTA